jgi:hypothetical protein
MDGDKFDRWARARVCSTVTYVEDPIPEDTVNYTEDQQVYS